MSGIYVISFKVSKFYNHVWKEAQDDEMVGAAAAPRVRDIRSVFNNGDLPVLDEPQLLLLKRERFVLLVTS